MTDKENLQQAGERLLSGAAQGVVQQAAPSVLGTVLALLGPKGLRRLAYGKEPAANPERIFNTLDDLSEAHLRDGGTIPMRPNGAPDVQVSVEPKLKPGYSPRVWDRKTKAFEPDKIWLPSNAPTETVAHEFGHLAAKSPAAKRLRQAGILASRPAAFALPSAIAALGAFDSLDSVSKAAPYVGAAQLATILANEAYANIRGAKLLELAGHRMPIAKKLRMFLPTASYLGHAATLIGLPYGVNKGIDAYNKAKEQGQKIKAKELLYSVPTQIADMPTYEALKQKWGDKLQEMR